MHCVGEATRLHTRVSGRLLDNEIEDTGRKPIFKAKIMTTISTITTEVVSATEAARLLGYNAAYVRRLIREKKMQAQKFGCCLVIPRSEIQRMQGTRYERR
jgi:excisionase family DNA binding protein